MQRYRIRANELWGTPTYSLSTQVVTAYLCFCCTDSRINHFLGLQFPQFTAGNLAQLIKGQVLSSDITDHELFHLKHRQTGHKLHGNGTNGLQLTY